MESRFAQRKYFSKHPHPDGGHPNPYQIDRKGFEQLVRLVYAQGCGLLDCSDPEDDLFCGGLSNLLDEIDSFIRLMDKIREATQS